MVRLTSLCALLFLSFLHVAVSQEKGKITNLGPQVYAAAIQGSTFFKTSTGEELVYTVVRGLPARFVGFKTESGEKMVDAALAGTDGSWDLVVSSDSLVYIAGANGVLYCHQPGTDHVKNLGKPLEDERLIWDLSAGENGAIYGGTYPGCRVFRYHPNEGVTDLTDAPFAAQENYVRSLEFHQPTQKIFVGVGSHAHLIEFNLKTKQRTNILPVADRSEEFVYNMKLVEGLRGGDRLFASVTGSDPTKNKTLVYNIKKKAFEASLPVVSIKEIIKAEKAEWIYYFSQGGMYRVDYGEKNPTPVRLVDFSEGVRAVDWDRNGKLSILTNSKKVFKYDPTNNSFESKSLEVPKLPIAIQSILVGPDQRVWSAGYLAGGHAAYDPKNGQTTAYDGLHQTEGMARMGDDLYFGVYTKALMYRFNTRAPWSLKDQNPRLLGKIPHQDRPFAVLPLPKTEQVLFGTIPAYGQLGGAIAHYHARNHQVEFFDQVVTDQSISSLAFVGGKVIGATSIFGGLGGIPTQKEAVLFEWDPVNGKKITQFVPLPGQMAITGLMEGPDGNLWGVGDGLLFVYDLRNNRMVKTVRLYEVTSRPSHIWRNAFLQVHPNGQVYVSAQRKLYCVNPSDFSYDIVAENVELLTMDEQGNLYMKNGSDLLRYEAPR
jgi:hypothetical protein